MAKYMETHELHQIKQQKQDDYEDGAVGMLYSNSIASTHTHVVF